MSRYFIFYSYVTKKRKFDIVYIINGVLGSLVSITGTVITGIFFGPLLPLTTPLLPRSPSPTPKL